ncbi:prephenate dehydratase [Rhabdothermincola sp.]|uniref:prephenate dehydratase n=1 Tax=Rhabdothermincola sp. TaxID=2820405 RepID=UPI002FE407D9
MDDAAASPPPLAADMASLRVGYLGPAGTFTEEALRTQPDLLQAQLVSIGSIPEVLAATSSGEVDAGFVAIENAIEGSVNVTLDTLAFEAELLIQREVVIAVDLCLLARPGVRIDDVKTVVSFPHATAQCRLFLNRHLPGVQTQASNSTADAARSLAEDGDERTAAIGTARAAEVYGLEVLASNIADHPENATRFVVVAREGIPPRTGHDKTSIVVFQRADVPGSLLSILQEFAARAINLSKLESRPTKRGLGDYCFLIDLEGHIDDELVADALRNLKSKQHDVKFLGSYPAAGEHGPEVRREAEVAWRAADEWVAALRAQVRR